MRRCQKQWLAVASVAVGLALVGSASDLAAQGSRNITAAMVDQWMTELSNWGRWGDDDERGTLNLITPEKRRTALALATAGVSVSLSHNYLTERAADATSPIGGASGCWPGSQDRCGRGPRAHRGGTGAPPDYCDDGCRCTPARRLLRTNRGA